MTYGLWLTIAGALMVFITVSASMVSRLPLSLSMLYLAAGVGLGPLGLALAAPGVRADSRGLEHLAEVVVLLSLFTSGLKMGAGLHDRSWYPPLRLALLSMLVTVALVSAAGVWLLGLPLGAALLLGGILAPTDPVLATDVQLSDPADRDQLRFALTGEGGLNDGTAFPVVMLGLGLLGLHEIGSFGWRWLAVDVLWATLSGLAIGALLGASIGGLVIHLRSARQEAVGHDSFIGLGLIALAYGLSTLVHGYGFLAVFAAGVALRQTERRKTAAAKPADDGGADPAPDDESSKSSESGESSEGSESRESGTDGEAIESDADRADPATAVPAAHANPDTASAEKLATHPRHASAFLAHAVLSFNEQLDRIGEVVAVMAIGLLLWSVPWAAAHWWFVPLMLLVVRPLSVALGLAGSRTSKLQRRLIGWFGIRGVGSLFYLAYALNHGLPKELADLLIALTFSVIVTSIVVHGISVTPLMGLYARRRRGP